MSSNRLFDSLIKKNLIALEEAQKKNFEKFKEFKKGNNYNSINKMMAAQGIKDPKIDEKEYKEAIEFALVAYENFIDTIKKSLENIEQEKDPIEKPKQQKILNDLVSSYAAYYQASNNFYDKLSTATPAEKTAMLNEYAETIKSGGKPSHTHPIVTNFVRSTKDSLEKLAKFQEIAPKDIGGAFGTGITSAGLMAVGVLLLAAGGGPIALGVMMIVAGIACLVAAKGIYSREGSIAKHEGTTLLEKTKETILLLNGNQNANLQRPSR